MPVAIQTAAGGSGTIPIAETDVLTHRGLRRAVTGPGGVYDDDNVTAITVGGGAAVTTVSVRSGSSSDFTLGARGGTITLNQTGDVTLDGSFTATSVIGALNELKTAGGGTLQQAYEAGNTIVTDSGNGALSVSGTEQISLVTSQAASNALNFQATNTAGGMQVNAGTTGNIDFNAGTSSGGNFLADGFNISIGEAATSGTISLGIGSNAQTVSLGTGAGAKTVGVGSTNTTSSLALNSGSGGINASSSSTITLGSTLAAANALTFNATTGVGAMDFNWGTGTTTMNGGAFRLQTTATTATAILFDSGATGGIELDAGTQGIDLNTTGQISITSSSASTPNTILIQASNASGQVALRGGTGASGQARVEAENVAIGTLSSSNNIDIGNLSLTTVSIEAGNTSDNNAIQLLTSSSSGIKLLGGGTSGNVDIEADTLNIGILSTTDTINIGNAGGVAIGFFGTTAAVRDTGWTTFTNLTTVKTLDADSTTLGEVADVLGTLIEQLKTHGLIVA